MKISFLINNIYGIGGTNRTVINLAEALAVRHDVEIVSVFRRATTTKFEISPRITVRALVDLRLGSADRGAAGSDEPSEVVPRQEEFYAQYSRFTDERIIRDLQKADADVVVGTRPSLNLFVAAHSRDGALRVAQEHMTHLAIPPAVRAEMARVYPRLDAVTTVTEADARSFLENTPIPGIPVVGIPNSVPQPAVPPSDCAHKVVVSAGRMHHIKRYDLLIRAFGMLAEEFPDWQLRIYGDGGEAGKLRTLVRELGLAGRALLMGGFSPIESEWAKGSIAAVTSSAESFGMTLVEAMRCGLPVVSTDCPVGPREILRDGEDGFLVPNGDAEAIAQGLRRLMADETLRRDMGAAALRNAARYDPAAVAARYVDLFEDAARRRAAAVRGYRAPAGPKEAATALTRHREAGHTPVVEHYRAYANRFWGYNLDSAAVTEKAEYLATYAGLDAPQACPHGTCERCGDRQLGPNPFRSTHMRSAAYRYSPTTDWLRLGPDGRLNAFGVLAGRLAFWTETAPASGEWKGPFVLGDGWLAPTLAVTGVPGGPAELVGLRRQSVVGSGVTVDVVHTVQDPDGNGFSGWRTLENPDWSHGDGRRQREVGVPSAAVDGMGRLHVFVRDFAQGISLRRRDTTGAWAPWEDLGGSFLQDAGTALTTENGTVELYVPGKNTVWRWYQSEPGGPFTLDDTLKTGRPATGGITAVDSGGGRTCLYYREAGTQQVMAYRQHADGRWPGSGAGLGGHGGTGAVAALWAPERGAREAFLAHRGSRGRPVVSLPDRDKDISGTHWRESGDMFTHAPAMARDAAGAVVLAVIGTDGRLHVRRQLSPAAGSPLGPWR